MAALTLRRDSSDGAATNGQVGSPSLAPRRRRIKGTEVALGLFIAVACALAAVLIHLGSVERTAVLAARVDVDQGQVIRAQDLKVVNVAADSDVAHVGREELDDVVGRRATTAIVTGQLLADGMTTNEDSVGPGEAVVGLALLPGQLPSLDLTAGDRVHVVSSTLADAEAGSDERDPVLTRSATVVSVEALDADRRLVTLVTSEADAEAVAAAAGSDSLRLVVVAS